MLVDCDADEASAYVASSEATWLVGHDAKAEAAMAYAGTSVPRTYMIGPDGVVVWHAHIQALKAQDVEAQFVRASWFDEKALPPKVKALARSARALKFGAATKAIEKLAGDQYTKEPEMVVVEQVRVP